MSDWRWAVTAMGCAFVVVGVIVAVFAAGSLWHFLAQQRRDRAELERLQATFRGQITGPDGYSRQVRHLDGNSRNNDPSNLVIADPEENDR
jgi:hypothetical protein